MRLCRIGKKRLASMWNKLKRILGLRETGFGDSALEQLPDPAREKIQTLKAKIAKSRFSRRAPGAGVSCGAERRFAAKQRRSPALPLPTAREDGSMLVSCRRSGAECGAPARRVFRDSAVARARFSLQRVSADFRIRVASALLEAGQPDAALKALDGLSATESVLRPKPLTGGRVAMKSWRPRLISDSTRPTLTRIASTN